MTATGATSIRYTTDGTTPTCSSTAYSSAISVATSTTIKALSCYPDSAASSVASFAYTLQCSTTSVSNGSVASYPSCAITCNSGYTLSGSSCVASGGGGGGGGGGGYYTPSTTTPTSTPVTTPVTTQASPQGQLDALLAQLAALQQQIVVLSGIPPSLSTEVFSRNLNVGSSGQDVLALQKFLNANGFTITASGQGSPGNETMLFGSLTRAALARFQAANGISPAVGYFGPITREYINANP